MPVLPLFTNHPAERWARTLWYRALAVARFTNNLKGAPEIFERLLDKKAERLAKR